ncbi:baseplate multidomain protein megatron [Paracoccus homiensis]|uniref:baseplate multidomain protein megatron n=1 Tax=Paracoccus homiensis TaxID=364199 RepID=UPI00398D5020
MATLVLGAAGAAIGGSIGGAILGVSAATIGGFIGSSIGSVVDSWIISSLAPTQRIEGARLDTLRITSATEGAVIPRLYGRMRMGGNIIWATDFREETKTTTQGGGKGGGGGKVKTTEYLYYASFAVALCEGPITGIGRIWADGKPMDLSGVTWRWYPGDEAQTADPFIAAKMGAANTPAYRGTAYVVFEELALSTYGNRLPQLSFEVFRPLADPDTAEGLTRAVTMIPASGEFTYATQAIRKTDGGATVPENLNALADSTDMVEALDRLQAMAPAVESVSLVVAWFGDDLRAGSCKVRPGVEVSAKSTTPVSWSVNGVSRANAFLVSRDDQDRPVYGGTPSDFAVVQAIQEMKARGLRVTFYPFILMDVPPGNTLPNPYSDNAAETGQPVFPWRGRITCSPAAGYAGSVDKTATAATQVAALFGAATPASFSVSGQSVSWTGTPGDWGLRRMVLHYAHLCAAAGGVDAFLIGTEMPGLTTIRSGVSTYPAVQAYRDLLADVRSILGSGTRIGYAADWSEYFGHQPGDGSGDVFFHLDPLWADPEIDFVGIDNYMPLSDWRDGFDHADAQEGWPAIYDRAYLQANIAGREGFDWFYASATDRSAQVTDLTLFGGANALAIESAPGVWEIVQAGAAELLAPGRYRLTRLLRGQRGTEGAMGNPAPAGARVVVLDDSLASLPIAEADLGIPWNWRIGPASRPVSDETYVAQTFTPAGAGLRPFSVAHVEQPWRRPRTPGDLTIRWTRRSRALSADSWGGLEVPLAEELETYEVEILDGAAVKRVLSAATTSAVYTAAQQSADWGAPLAPGDTVNIRIYQLSALVGRGAPKTVTLTF